MYSDVVFLINQTFNYDEVGNKIPISSTTKTYAKKKNVSTKEFYSAMGIGIKPSIEFQLRKSNYNNQLMVNYDNVNYSVIRTINKPPYDIVLVCEVKSGK